MNEERIDEASCTDRSVLTSAEAAELLGISPRTLANWRVQGRGPVYVRIGKKRSPVLYRICDIEDWLDSRLIGSASRKTSASARR